jgi:hypothetical protein
MISQPHSFRLWKMPIPEKLKKRPKNISNLWKIDSLNINEILRLATRFSLRQR